MAIQVAILLCCFTTSIAVTNYRPSMEDLTDREIANLERIDARDHAMIVNRAFAPDGLPAGSDDSSVEDDDDDEDEEESKPSSSSVPEVPKSWNLQIPLPVVQNPSCKHEETGSESKKITAVSENASDKPHNITKRDARQDIAEDADFDDKGLFGQYENTQQPNNMQANQQQAHHRFTHHQAADSGFRDPGPQRQRILQSSMRFQPMSQDPPAPVRLHNHAGLMQQQQQQSDPRPQMQVPLMPDSSSPENDEEEVAAPPPKYKFNYDIPKDSFQSEVVNGQFSTFAKLPNNFESLIQSDTSFLDSMSEYPSDGSSQNAGSESAPDSRSGSTPLDFASQFDNDDQGGSDISTPVTPSPQPISMSQAIRSIHNQQFGSRSTPAQSDAMNDGEKLPAASRLRNRLFRRVRRPSNEQVQQKTPMQVSPPVHRYERRMEQDDDNSSPLTGSSEVQFLKRLGDFEDDANSADDKSNNDFEYETDLLPVKAVNYNWMYSTTTPAPVYPTRPAIQYTTPAPPPVDPSKEIVAQVRVLKNGPLENIRRHGEISVKYHSEPVAVPPPPPPPPSYTTPAPPPPPNPYATPPPPPPNPYTTPPPPPPNPYTAPPPPNPWATQPPPNPYATPPPPPNPYATPPPPPNPYATQPPPNPWATPPQPQYPTAAPPPTYPQIPSVPPVYTRPTPPPPPPTYSYAPAPPTTTTPAPYAWLDDSPPSQLPKVVYAIMMMDKQKGGRRRRNRSSYQGSERLLII